MNDITKTGTDQSAMNDKNADGQLHTSTPEAGGTNEAVQTDPTAIDVSTVATNGD